MFNPGRVAATFLIAMLFPLFAVAAAETADSVVVSSKAHARIDFKVNITDFDNAYHANDSIVGKMLADIDSMVLNPRMRVEHIRVTGTASPEGPYPANARLAEKRADALVALLQNRYSFPDSIYTISTIPEDWEGMRNMLSEDNAIPYAEAVISFIDESADMSPDLREHKLKNLLGGRPYSSMRDNVFPFLRRASVTVDYDSVWMRMRELSEPALPQPPVVVQEEVIEEEALPSPRRRFFAFKTNLLWDAILCANLGVELELWPKWSLDVPVWYSPYDITDRWRIRLLAVQPEVRYWLKEAGAGHYFGVHATVAGFNISTGGDYRYQDPNHAAFGAGVGYGYSFHLDKARHWSLEAQIGAGFISYKWTKYHNTGRNGAEISHGKGTYWGITRAGLTLSYKLYKERKERRWMKW